MHFVHILSYTWENGGASKVVYDLAKFQIENGDSVTIITMDLSGHRRYKDIEGVRFIPIKEHFLSKVLPLFSTQLWNILRDKNQQFDVIHLHGLWNYTLLAAHLLKLHHKCIVTVHGCAHPYTFNGNTFKRSIFSLGFQKDFLKKVKIIHVLHEGERLEVERYLGSKVKSITVIPNGIDVPDLSVKCNQKNNTVLFLSRLHHKKGLDLLLPAFKKTIEQVPDAILIIAGPDFGMLDFVQKFIEDNSLQNNIRYIGTIHNQDKVDLLLSSKVFVLPSYSEGFSIAVLEALVYEIPVVVSSETGLSNEIQEMKSGIVAELDIDSISAGITMLLVDSEKSQIMASNARKLVIERFETSKVCSIFDNEVKSVFHL